MLCPIRHPGVDHEGLKIDYCRKLIVANKVSTLRFEDQILTLA